MTAAFQTRGKALPELKLSGLRGQGSEQPAAGPAQPAPGSQNAGPQTGSPETAGAQTAGSQNARPQTASAPQVTLRRAAAQLSPAALWRSHRLFTIVALISLVPRILAALSFRPALLTADSFLYMQGAVDHNLGAIRPSGYSAFLAPFAVLPHTLLAVTTVQHLMGIAIGAIVYGLLRYWGLPAWGATLAAAPVLLDTREIALESFILPDVLFCLVLMVVVALLLTRSTPRLWQCAVAGLLMAYVTVLRGNGLPLVVIVALFLLIRKVGWRSLAAAAAAFAIPVLGYILVFHSEYGQFNLTSSDGIFLWSRTTSFANCAVIKPPRDLVPLCPTSQTQIKKAARAPAWSVSALLNEPAPADYLWASDAWWRHDAHPGINAYNNKLGMRFALDAIKAQPGGYLAASARDIMLGFLATDRPQSQTTMTFTTRPHIAKLPSYYARYERNFAGTTSNTHPVYPYAYFLFLYQQPVYFPGVVLLLVFLAGLVGVVRKWRSWGGMQALPWALAAVSIISPALATQELYRYMMVAIPLACLALGLSFARRAPDPRGAETASARGLVPAAAGAGAAGTAGSTAAVVGAPADAATADAATADAAAADGTKEAAAQADDSQADTVHADPAQSPAGPDTVTGETSPPAVQPPPG
jgi:hypothetical protein